MTNNDRTVQAGATMYHRGQAVSQEELAQLFPKQALESTQEYRARLATIGSRVINYPQLVDFFVQGRPVTNTRLFMVLKGGINIGHINKDGKFVPYLFLEPEDGSSVFMIPHNSSTSDFTVKAGSMGASILHIGSEDLAGMLKQKEVAKKLVKQQGKLVKSICQSEHFRQNGTGHTVLPLLALCLKIAGSDAEKRKNLIKDLSKFLIDHGVPQKLSSVDPKKLVLEVVHHVDSHPELADDFLSSILTLYLRIFHNQSTLVGVTPIQMIEALQVAIVRLGRLVAVRT